MTEVKNQIFDFTSGAATNAPVGVSFADFVAGGNKIRGSLFGYLSDSLNLDQPLDLARPPQLPSPHYRAWVLVRRRDMTNPDGTIAAWGKNLLDCLGYVEKLTYTNAKGKVLPITENDGLSLSWYEITENTKKSKYVSRSTGEEKEGTRYELGRFESSEYTVADDTSAGDLMIMVRSNFAPALSVKTRGGGIVSLLRDKGVVVRQASSKEEPTNIKDGRDRELFDASFDTGRLTKINFSLHLRLKDKSPQTSCYIDSALGFEDGYNQEGLIPRTIKKVSHNSGSRSTTLSDEDLALVGKESSATKVVGDDEIPF